MRRFILVFMMVLLPLQWSWAAAASVCGHESEGAHVGHHEHRHEGHDAPEVTPAPMAPDAPGDTGPSDFHPDCQVCHGLGVAFAPTGAAFGQRWAPEPARSTYGRFVPEPPVEGLLRPPMSLVA